MNVFHYMTWLSLILSRMMGINKPMREIMEMLYMHPVYVVPESVKDICLSKPSLVRGSTVYS